MSLLSRALSISRASISRHVGQRLRCRGCRTEVNQVALVDPDNCNGVSLGQEASSDVSLASFAVNVGNDCLEEKRILEKPLAPRIPIRSFNLAPFLSTSTTLQKLLSLGVSLAEVEKYPAVSETLLKLDYERDILSRVLFLNGLGISAVGRVISKSPSVLLEDLDDMKVRVNYLKFRRFSDASIEKIVSRCPDLLCESVPDLDAALGRLQKDFSLSGDDVRVVVTKHPKLVLFDWMFVTAAKVELREFLGFSPAQLRGLIIDQPKLLTTAHYHLRKRFDYLYNVMGITHGDIVAWPSILRAREHVVKQRHLFLAALGRAQYDGTRANFVSLKELVSLPLPEFCQRVAKADVCTYNDFLKTL